MSVSLSTPLQLPCGATLNNRIAKAAMSEGLADAAGHSTSRLETLYAQWARSGAGLLISGNFQVDSLHIERAANVVITDEGGDYQLKRLAAAGTSNGTQFWVQLSHTGRQVDASINPRPLAPSVVEIEAFRGVGANFSTPVAMTEHQIITAINQFSYAADSVQRAGFTGIELQAAHGYLISQFLSPRTNQRMDNWGGSLENRAKFLFEIIKAVRAKVGPKFPIGIKLNASDFIKGGFSHAECIQLVKMLNDTSVDLIELSGGSLEQPKVVGVSIRDEGEPINLSQLKREAYFVDFARAIRETSKIPIMVTGGFRNVGEMTDALSRGDLDVIGLARPFAADPEIPLRILSGEISRVPSPETTMDVRHTHPWNGIQIERMSTGLLPDLRIAGETAVTSFLQSEAEKLEALAAHRLVARA